jgi:hypothetical protein
MESTLHLTLKKKWFDMIASGVKREEYREMKPYWNKRLMCNKKQYNKILFRNGYGKNAPSLLIEFTGLQSGLGILEWGAPERQEVFILKLGRIISTWNIK